MNIVIVGHVDHGKSTVIGRLLADTGSLPNGKLEQVKEMCRKTSKPFEYAFLLDALKDEQSQGITIDTARSFFKTKNRDYIIIDAPGHIEFLKNMITGAARAEAALLVIDAKEGVQENSRRHGHMVSMLGVRQVTVIVNKMDLVEYDEKVFEAIKSEYTGFLRQINVKPVSFIPISAREGDVMVKLSEKMPWYKNVTVLEQLDLFVHEKQASDKPFRFPVQDIYKFTQNNDERRIVAGTVDSGTISTGEEVIFLPSGKRSTIKSIEAFNSPAKTTAGPGEATGFTLTTQIYIRPGELMVKSKDTSTQSGRRFKANIFWVGRAPMVKDKTYKLKLAGSRTTITLVEVNHAIDASDLSTQNKQQVDRHDVAECIFETPKPVAYDLACDNEGTGRFVIVDNYEIAGGGILLENIPVQETILQQHIKAREYAWDRGLVSPQDRDVRNKHKAKFIVLTGSEGVGKRAIARELEKALFERRYSVYYMGIANLSKGLDADIVEAVGSSEARIRHLGELARIMTDTGLIFISTIDNADDYDIETLRLLNEPNEIITINVGEPNFTRLTPDLQLEPTPPIPTAVERIISLLKSKDILFDYVI